VQDGLRRPEKAVALSVSGLENTNPPDNRDVRKRIVLLILALTALISIATLLSAPSQQDRDEDSLPPHSIYSTAPRGCRAWYLTLQKAGLPVRIWDRRLADAKIPTTPSTLVLISPKTTFGAQTVFSEADAQALLNWAAQGHTVFLLDDFRRSATQSLLRQFELQPGSRISVHPEWPNGNYVFNISKGQRNALEPLNNYSVQKYLFRADKPILTASRRALPKTMMMKVGLQTELTDRWDHLYLVSLPYKRGRLILGTADDLAENRYLNGPNNDNFQFFANRLAAEKKPILIDEFVHGYMASPDLTEYYWQKTPLGRMMAALGMGFLFVIWLGLRRWPTRQLKETNTSSWVSDSFEDDEENTFDQARKSSAPTHGVGAFANQMATVYERAQAAPLALGPMLTEFDRRLERRFGISREDEASLRHLLTQRLASISRNSYSSNSDADPVAGQTNAFDCSPGSCEKWLTALDQARTVVASQKRLSPAAVLRLSQQLIVLQEILYGAPTFSPARR
jgi:Domain of unknown function (DUF4350)